MKKPHIVYNPAIDLWTAFPFRGANRPIVMVHKFERLCRVLKRRHDIAVERRRTIDDAAKWYDFKSKHDIN